MEGTRQEWQWSLQNSTVTCFTELIKILRGRTWRENWQRFPPSLWLTPLYRQEETYGKGKWVIWASLRGWICQALIDKCKRQGPETNFRKTLHAGYNWSFQDFEYQLALFWKGRKVTCRCIWGRNGRRLAWCCFQSKLYPIERCVGRICLCKDRKLHIQCYWFEG